MSTLNLADNIIRLRKERKITQEQLAEFIGVTKASVSKWETRQSMPDILLLPQLATFFNVTVDELIGYEPQLSKEQIKKIYMDLAQGFANESFNEMMEKSRRLVKQYYNCYPLLYQLCILWLNHFMLADTQEEQQTILKETVGVCERIISDCDEISLCNDAVCVKAMLYLILGDAQSVIDTLEEMLNPMRVLGESTGVLVQAYQMTGNVEQADRFNQITMYGNILSLVASSKTMIELHSDDLTVCEETIRRVETIAQAYDIEHLNTNSVALFWYQVAIVYSIHGKKEESLIYLTKFVDSMEYLIFQDIIMLHGDSYFTKLDYWVEQLDLNGQAPRDKKVIWESAMTCLERPEFTILQTEDAFKKLKERLLKGRELLCQEN